MPKLLFTLTLVALFCVAGCSHYNGPEVGTVGVTGSYSDRQGETYGGGVNVGLNYPTPTPKPVDHSK